MDPNIQSVPTHPDQFSSGDTRPYDLPVQGTTYGSQNLTNHDLVTPVLDTSFQGTSSRRSSMNRLLFRRKGMEPSHFDDDTGADLLEFAAARCSMNDLTHLRDLGRYNTMGFASSDTAPIIPTLGTHENASIKGMNNVQYRKFMNLQKKRNLTQSARAMSLAGGNPMAASDSRTLSFLAGPYERAMSLGGMNPAPPNNDRAMSLNSAHPLMAPQNQYQNPQFSPQYNQQFQPHNGPGMAPRPSTRFNATFPHPQGQSYGMGHNSGMPHTMSLRSSNGFQQRAPPSGGRANSMGIRSNTMHGPQNFGHFAPNGHLHVPIHGGPSPYQYNPGLPMANQHLGGYASHMNGGAPRTNSFGDSSLRNSKPPMSPNGPSNTLNVPLLVPDQINGMHMQGARNGVSGSPVFNNHGGVMFGPGERSTDSLMNVLEEEEEPSLYLKDLSENTIYASSPVAEDGDHVFRFDSLSPLISRKNTIKKANSKRVRKLDLFSSEARKNVVDEIPGLSRPDVQGLDMQKSRILTCDNSVQSKGGPIRSPIRLKSLTANTAFNNFRSVLSQAPIERTEPQFEKSDAKSFETSSQIELESVFNTPTPLISGSTKTQEKDSTNFLPSSQSSTKRLSLLQVKAEAEELKGVETKEEDADLPKQKIVGASHNNEFDVQANSEAEETSFARLASCDSQTFQDAESRTSGEIVLRNLAEQQEINISHLSPAQQRTSALSGSKSELKLQGLLSSSTLLKASPNTSLQEEDDKKEKRRPTARAFIKRLSMGSSKRADENSKETTKEPFSFSKEELAIITCSNELQNELQLVTSELAMSIKRELELEIQLRARDAGRPAPSRSEGEKGGSAELAEKSRLIAELQEKLNNERRLRFISEEHAILAEHGQKPSALKLNYEKNEIYKQLLAKKDLVTQLQDKLDEISVGRSGEAHESLLHKYNDLVKENSELKARLREAEAQCYSDQDGTTEDTSDDDSDAGAAQYKKEQILSLRTQRDELREMIVKLTVSQSTELKAANDRIKMLESKLEKMSSINAKLSKRMLRFETENTRNQDPFSSPQGGKLQGLSVLSQTNKLFD